MIEDSHMTFSPKNGIFGWLQPDLQFKTIVLYGFFGTFWGSSCGYLILMKFFSPVICMNALLVEPVIAQIMGCLLGVDHIPGIMTIFGVTTLLVAIHLINRGASIKQRDKQYYLKQMEL